MPENFSFSDIQLKVSSNLSQLKDVQTAFPRSAQDPSNLMKEVQEFANIISQASNGTKWMSARVFDSSVQQGLLHRAKILCMFGNQVLASLKNLLQVEPNRIGANLEHLQSLFKQSTQVSF